MRKVIIPVFLVCMLLVSQCKKKTDGIQGAIDVPAGHLTYGNKSTSIKKDTDKIKTAGKNTEIGKKDPAISSTNSGRKPGGLLVKPRVDVPEVK
jgi:hypothetical protein